MRPNICKRVATSTALAVTVSLVIASCGSDIERALATTTSTRITKDDKAGATTSTSKRTAPKRSSTTTSSTTTTMPPRAKPLKLDPADSGSLNDRIIVIDPGHNGRNYAFVDVMRPGGADAEQEICNTAGSDTDSGVEESAIVWAISENIVPVLRRAGATVVLTRPDDDGFGPCADERGKIAVTYKADLFLSLHADGDESGGSGYHLIHPGVKPNVSAEAVEESLRYAEAAIIRLRFAGLLPANYVGDDGIKERTNLANLNIANRASTLAELGNLVHPKDSELLTDDYVQQVIANALVLSILDFFGVEVTGEVDLNGDGEIDVNPAMTVPTTTTTTTTLPTTTLPVLTLPPETLPPETLPPETLPPMTQAPTTQTTTTQPPPTTQTTTSTTSTTAPVAVGVPVG